MAFLLSISDRYQKALHEVSRRMIGHGTKAGADADGWRAFLAERLIALAAGAVFLVAPVCIVLSGFGLPGTYGAAAAVALTFVAIPFLALGWLSISGSPWTVGIFALAAWSALAGTLIAVSPLLALTSGLVLFHVAAGRGATARILAQATADSAPEDALPVDSGHEDEITIVDLSAEGAITHATGYRDGVLAPRRLFVDHVHLADRIAFLAAFSDLVKHRKETAQATVRLNLAQPGQAQAFASARIDMTRTRDGVVLKLHETAERPVAENDGMAVSVQRRFLATVSHELRTPLNSIIGFSDILRRDLFGALANERQREYVDLIHSSGTHLLSVVNTILDVSKIDAGTYGIMRDTFDLNGMVEECVSMLRPQADAKGLTLDLETAPEIVEADGDRRALKQVAINLLSNAVKFTEQGGAVSIATQRRERGFAIVVSDTGIGMTGEELALIGTPFMQADNTYTRSCEGTGLGLTVVRGLVQLHGGTLDVESVPGGGTRVTVFVPENTAGDSGSGTVTGEITTCRHIDGPDSEKRRTDANAVRLAG